MSDQPATAPQPVLLVIGAGPGIGRATAARFSREGYRVGLLARDAAHLQTLAETLGTPAEVATATADIRNPDQMRSALRELTDVLGDADVVCVSPLPDIDRIKPVLKTRTDDLTASFELTVAGIATVVEAVVPAMRRRGSGVLIATTGSAGERPSEHRAASAVTTTAATVYLRLLRDALSEDGVRVAHVAIAGGVGAGERHEATAIAQHLWKAASSTESTYTFLT